MSGGERNATRRGLTAVILLLAALLGFESTSAQAAASLRPAATAAAYTAVPQEHSETSEDDSKPRHGPRRPGRALAPAGAPARVSVRCDAVEPTAHRHLAPGAVRESAARGRSVGLPLLHQALRC
jgi:hypothetical protein